MDDWKCRYATLEAEGKLAALERSIDDEEADVIDEEDELSDSGSFVVDVDYEGEAGMSFVEAQSLDSFDGRK